MQSKVSYLCREETVGATLVYYTTMKENKYVTFLNIWTIVYVLLLSSNLVLQLKYIDLANSRDFADLFINYEGGFVRRGILGQFFIYLLNFNINPVHSALLLSLMSYIIIACYLVYQYKVHKYPFGLLTVCFLLGGFSLYKYTFFRRDFMILCVFLAIVKLWKRMPIDYWVFVANLLLILSILSYEPFAFFAMPSVFLLAKIKGIKFVRNLLCWLPSILAFLVCCKYSGGQAVYDDIWKSVSCFLKSPGILEFLTYNSKDVMLFHLSKNFLGCYHGIPVVLISMLGIVGMIYFVVNSFYAFEKTPSENVKRNYLLQLMLLYTIVLLPMYVCLSTDYSRISMYSAIAALIVYFELSNEELERMFSAKLNMLTVCFLKCQDRIICPTRRKIVIFLLFLGMSTWTGANDFVWKTEIGGAVKMIQPLCWKICSYI